MTNKVLILTLIGILCLYASSTALTGLAALIVTIVGFLCVTLACGFSVKKMMDRNNR